MKKYLLPLLFATACSNAPNVPEVRVKSEVPDAKCETAHTELSNIEVAVCTLPEGGDVISAYSPKHPWQVWKFQTLAEARKAQQGSGSGSATGSGSAGSGSAK